MVLAYYAVLMEHEPFRRGFQRFTSKMQRLEGIDSDNARVRRSLYYGNRPTGFERWFCERWRLPTDEGFRDLRFSLRGGRSGELTLTPDKRWTVVRSAIGWSIPRVVELSNRERLDFLVPPTEPTLVPSLPLPIVYDPRRMSRAELSVLIDQTIKQVKTSIVAQADLLDRQARAAGWNRFHSDHLDDAQRRRLALRLRRRAIEELGWHRIAKLEGGEHPEGIVPDAHSVKGTVGLWAAALKIPLPRIAPGRPRRKCTD